MSQGRDPNAPPHGGVGRWQAGGGHPVTQENCGVGYSPRINRPDSGVIMATPTPGMVALLEKLDETQTYLNHLKLWAGVTFGFEVEPPGGNPVLNHNSSFESVRSRVHELTDELERLWSHLRTI